MQSLKLFRLRARCSCVPRMSSSVVKPTLKYPFFKPRSGELGAKNPLLELSKPKTLRESMVKGLIVRDHFDERLLTYPEVLDESRSRAVDKLHDRLKNYVDNLDPDVLKAGLSPEVREKLKSFGMFGALIPEEFGGQGLSFTEFARCMEAFANNRALASIVIAHNCTVPYSILHYGSEELKSKYLPKIASGEYVCAFAFAEASSGSDLESCECRARQLVGEEHMEISGEKIFVTNGQFADLFLTVTSVKHFSADLADGESRPSVVLVERDLPGVKVNRSSAIRGLHGNGLASVTFDNVRVSNEHVLGTPGDAAKIVRGLHSPLKLSLSAAVLGALKSAFAKLLWDLGTKPHISRQLDLCSDTQRKVSEMAMDIYSLESAIYLNAAIEDCVEKPDSVVEVSVAGLSCMESAMRFAESCVELYGPEAYEEGHSARALQRDMNCLLWFYQTDTLWKLLVSMNSVKLAGAATNERIRILRDPFTYPKECFQLFKGGMSRKAVEQAENRLGPFVHPSLKSQAKAVACCQIQLQKIVESLLSTYGAKFFEYQVVLSRLTNMIRDVYLATAALARLNRSVTHGSESAELETQLFQGILEKAHNTLKTEFNDDVYIEASVVQVEVEVFEKLINDGRYSFEHPLTKNF